MFGLSLLGLVEIAVLVGGIVGIGSSLIIARAIRKSNRALLEHQEKTSSAQLEQQRKVNSAQLALRLLENWKESNTFTRILLEMEKPNVKFTDKEAVHYMLATFEDIAALRKDGTLTETHVQEFFGRDIVRIDNNKSVMGILDEYHNEEPIHNYSNLKKLLDDSKEWGMQPYSSDESLSSAMS